MDVFLLISCTLGSLSTDFSSTITLAYSAVVPTSQRVGTKVGLAKKGE